jgi:membrane fusion protein
LWGDVLIISPPTTGIVSLIICTLLVVIGAYLYSGEYSLKVSGTGELVPLDGIAKVYSPKVGTVSAVFVKEGDAVKKGDKLFSIEVNRLNENGEAVDYALVEAAKNKLLLVAKNQENEKERHNVALERLDSNQSRNKKSLTQVVEQINLQKTIIADIQKIIEETDKLVEQGYFSRAEQSRQKIEQLNQVKQLAVLKRQKIELENEISRAKNDKDELSVTYRQARLQLEKEALSLEEQLLSLESARFTLFTAPRNGIVSGIQVVTGTTVNGRIPLLSIVPENQALYAHLYIPASAIGFVKKAQTVRLSFDAYDYRKFGTYNGKIESITDVLFKPSETPTSVKLNESSYRLIVKLDQQFIEAYGKSVPLKPNMYIKADVVLASRRLFEWFIDPFIRFQKAS